MARPGYVSVGRDGEWLVRVWAKPGASRSSVLGVIEDSLKVGIGAVAVDGKANKELIRFMAETLGVRPAHVTLKSGTSGRKKIICVKSDVEPEWP